MKNIVVYLILLAFLAGCGSGKSDYTKDNVMAEEMIPVTRADFDAPPPPPAGVASEYQSDEIIKEDN